MKPISDGEKQCLIYLAMSRNRGDQGYKTPMEIGGYDGSRHSYWLSRLIQRGLVERKRRGIRGSFKYRATHQGLDEARNVANATMRGYIPETIEIQENNS